MKQKTISKEVRFSGPGLHLGKKTSLVIKPAKPNTGYVFVRTDIDDRPEIPALSDYVNDTSRGTTISKDGYSISTIEHLLAATYALGIDNVVFEIDGEEVPILDGSSKYFVEAYHKSGIVEQDEDLIIYDIKENLSFINEERDIEINVFPDKSYKLSVLVDYKSDIVSNQYAVLDSLKNFTKQIADCRTFVFVSELEPLLRLNLIKGGDLDNAIVIVDKQCNQEEYDRLSKLFNKPKIEVQSSGVLNNLKLKFINEPARHKLLDLIGDLALTGFRFNANVVARRPGHYGNTELARVLRKYILENKNKLSNNKEFLNLDLHQSPVISADKISDILSSRVPFILIDKVMSLSKDEIVGVKNVANDEFYFNNRIYTETSMPCCLQLESLLQMGRLFILQNLKFAQKYQVNISEITNIKIYNKVVPGDVIISRLVEETQTKNGYTQFYGESYVGNNLVFEAVFNAELIKIQR